MAELSEEVRREWRTCVEVNSEEYASYPWAEAIVAVDARLNEVEAELAAEKRRYLELCRTSLAGLDTVDQRLQRIKELIAQLQGRHNQVMGLLRGYLDNVSRLLRERSEERGLNEARLAEITHNVKAALEIVEREGKVPK